MFPPLQWIIINKINTNFFTDAILTLYVLNIWLIAIMDTCDEKRR